MGVLLLVAMPYGDKVAMLQLVETVKRRQSSGVTDQYKSLDEARSITSRSAPDQDGLFSVSYLE